MERVIKANHRARWVAMTAIVSNIIIRVRTRHCRAANNGGPLITRTSKVRLVSVPVRERAILIVIIKLRTFNQANNTMREVNRRLLRYHLIFKFPAFVITRRFNYLSGRRCLTIIRQDHPPATDVNRLIVAIRALRHVINVNFLTHGVVRRNRVGHAATIPSSNSIRVVSFHSINVLPIPCL